MPKKKKVLITMGGPPGSYTRLLMHLMADWLQKTHGVPVISPLEPLTPEDYADGLPKVLEKLSEDIAAGKLEVEFVEVQGATK